jgi:hypothetical protein
LNFKEGKVLFSIRLHISELKTLKLIQKNLHCGNISKDKYSCELKISDIYSIFNIIIPIFDFLKLKSSKLNTYIIFRKAAFLINPKLYFPQINIFKLILLKRKMLISNKILISNNNAETINNITLN